MPLDDLRPPRSTLPASPAALPAEDAYDPEHDPEQPFEVLTPEAQEASWQAKLAEIRRDGEAWRAGRLVTVPWDEVAERWMFEDDA